METKKMHAAYIILKIIFLVLLIFFLSDAAMEFISYHFYKGNFKKETVTYEPVKLQINDSLTGYGYNLDKETDKVILFFGGSMYIAYNTVGMYAGAFDCPFLSVDSYGSQESRGKMNLKTLQKSAEDLYDYARRNYPNRDIYVFGHSYGCGMAAYTASVRECKHLTLASGYSSSAVMYNKIIPIFHGPFKVFIKNNIRVDEYAKETTCPVTVLGSDADTTLDVKAQEDLASCYKDATLKIFKGISHEDYFVTDEVTEYVKKEVLGE